MPTIVEITDANNPYTLGTDGYIDDGSWPHYEVELHLTVDNVVLQGGGGEGIVDISGPHAFTLINREWASTEIRSITGGAELEPSLIRLDQWSGVTLSEVSSEALANLTVQFAGLDTSVVLNLNANNLPSAPGEALRITGLNGNNAAEISLGVDAKAVSARLEDGLTSFYDADNNKIAQLNIEGMTEDRLSEFAFHNGRISIQCFARGTKIATPDGELTVEDFKPGDIVLTANGGTRVVKWVAQRSIDTATIPPDQALAAFPIRFAPASLADGVPHRELIVSPWHHFCFDGYLVPAVLLVNGKTIVQDFSVKSIDYFHLELDQFDMLLSEGAATESYYDTGNRSMFANAPVTALRPTVRLSPKRPGVWRDHVLSKGPIIEAIKEKLLQRAEQLTGFTRVDDPRIHLTIGDSLEPIWPQAMADTTYEFRLPESGLGRAIHIRSRSAAAREMAAHSGKDLRQLGIALGNVLVCDALGNRSVNLDDPGIRGLHPMSVQTRRRPALRWTDGDCVLPAGAINLSERATLTVTVAKTYKYWHKSDEKVASLPDVQARSAA